MLRMLVEMVTEAALVAVGPNDAISECNQRFAEMVGVPCQDLIGVGLRRFLTSDGARELSALRDTGGGEGEMVLVSRQDVRLSVQYRAKPIEFGGALALAVALISGFGGTHIDSSSSASQQKLRTLLESERKLRAFLESAPDAIVIMNQSGDLPQRLSGKRPYRRDGSRLRRKIRSQGAYRAGCYLYGRERSVGEKKERAVAALVTQLFGVNPWVDELSARSRRDWRARRFPGCEWKPYRPEQAPPLR